MGYHRAGFDVTGVDIAPQKNYPFKFIQADALDYLREHGHEYDVIHASPPCQLHSSLKNLFVNKPDYQARHIDLIPQTRELLEASGKPYVIENVVGSPLRNPIMLCGSQFGLKVYRHRLFESSVMLFAPNHAPHNDKMKSASVSPKGFITVGGDGGLYNLPEGVKYMEYASAAMGIDWMSRTELSQSIPPAYTEYIGKQLMQVVTERKTLKAA